MSQTILVVEDEAGIADTITYALKTEGFHSLWVTTGAAATQKLQSDHVDLIILDIGLPDCNGFELCKEIRRSLNIPIVFLTARNSEIDRIVGLEIGGDDYLVKPFSPRELTARVKVILRRCSGSSQDLSVNSTRFEVLESRYQITYMGSVLNLSKTEYRILKTLIDQPGRVFSREQVMDAAWDEPESSLERTVDAHIKTIRAKLKSINPNSECIQTHRGLGYSLQVKA